MKAAVLLLLSCGYMLVGQPNGTFVAGGRMWSARARHTATLLRNGQVLIAGGYQLVPHATTLVISQAELYDPSTGTFTTIGDMITPRYGHTATLLSDGRVLIVGGYQERPGQTIDLASAELYDPSTGAFTPTGSMVTAQHAHTATLLADGNVLIAGGKPDHSPAFAAAEIYDAANGTFHLTGAYAVENAVERDGGGPSAAALPEGAVLLTGWPSTEIYDPRTGTFRITGPGYVDLADSHTATLLLTGKVLIAGGAIVEEFGQGFLKTAIEYDPRTECFTRAGDLIAGRTNHTATLLPDGRVLIAGGILPRAPELPMAELYDASDRVFSATGAMTTLRYQHTATLLADGRVLITGGMGLDDVALSSAELYTSISTQSSIAFLREAVEDHEPDRRISGCASRVAGPR